MSIKVQPNTYAKSKHGEYSEGAERHRDQKKYVTGQPIGSDRHALDVISVGYAYRGDQNRVAESGSNDTIIVLTAHGCKRGDIIRFKTTSNSIEQEFVSIDEVIDANSFRLSAILSAEISAADTFDVYKPIAQRYSENGAQIVEIEPGPVAYKLDGVTTTVTEDTVDAANNRPLPVKLTGFMGDIEVTADQLNVKIRHDGDSPDSVRVGDGTNILGVNADNEALVFDEDTHGKLDILNTSVGSSLSATQLNPATDAALISYIRGLLSYAKDNNENFSDNASFNFGLDTAALRVAAQIGNAAGGADFNAGVVSAQTIRVVLESQSRGALGASADARTDDPNGTHSLIALIKGMFHALDNDFLNKIAYNYGDTTGGLRVAAQLGNAAGANDYGAGASGAQTPRMVLESQSRDVLGAVADTSITDHTLSGSMVAFIKGVVSRLTDIIAKLPATLGQKVMSESLAVTIASNQSPVPVQNGTSSNMSVATLTSVSETGQNATSPAGAISFYITNSPSSPSGVRWGNQGGSATKDIGPILLPGATTPVMPYGGDMSFFAQDDAGGNSEINIVWFIA